MERQTRQREVICRVLEREHRPLSPQEILGLAQGELPKLGLATVYRALRDLAAEGWLRTVELPGSGALYEVEHHHHHHHFQCRRCGRVFEVEGCKSLDDLVPQGFALEDHEIILYGRCRDCG